MLHSPWSAVVRIARETTSEVVDLPNDNPVVLECLLKYLYTGDYDDGEYPDLGTPSSPANMTRQTVASNSAVSPGVVIEACSTSTAFIPSRYLTTHSPKKRRWGWDADEPDGLEASPVQRSLFLPLRLCIMADKYDVPALAVLARNRLYRTAEMCWRTCDEFPAFVDELYRHTPPKDLGLRKMVCRLVGAGLLDEVTKARMEAVMRKHGDFAVDVMNHYIDSETAI